MKLAQEYLIIQFLTLDYCLQSISDQHTIMLVPTDFQQEIHLKEWYRKQDIGLVNYTQ